VNRTVLMSGASGYAGAAAAAALRAAGMMVFTVGRRAGDDVAFDLLRPECLAAEPVAQGVDVLVHVAAAHEVGCRDDAIAAYTANVTATRALLEFAIASGARRLLYVSTFHVFGAPTGRIDESRTPRPVNDYGLTHLLAEQVFLALARRHGLAAHILRPANLFGAPMHWTGFNRWTLAPFDFVRQAMHQGEIVLRTDGAPVRNYVSLPHFCGSVLAAARGELPEVVHVTGSHLR
jgi:UDP-glucose 4-epimerase